MSNYTNEQVDGVHMHLENRKIGKFFFWYIWVMYALVYMTKYCFSSALAPIVESGLLTKSQTGFISASFHFVYAPLQVVGGVFADRYNPERMIKLSLGGSAIANLIIFFNQNYYVMLFAWMFNAIAQFAIWPSVFKIMASQLPRSERKKNAFYMSFCSSSGLLVSYLIAGSLPDWRYNFVLASLILLTLMVSMHFVCKKVDRYMLPDKDFITEYVREKDTHGYTLKSLILSSGLLFLVLVSFMRFAIEQGSKTMAPTMLMEAYDGISASLGNFLNAFIIIAGISGTLLVKFVLYPKIIKNEVTGVIVCLAMMIPFTIVMSMIGDIPAAMIVFSMCAIAFIGTASSLFVSYYNMSFAPFGKDGFVAGVMNCAASAALIAQSYGFNVVADKSGWQAVSYLWIIMTVIALVAAIIALPLYVRFRNNNKKILGK